MIVKAIDAAMIQQMNDVSQIKQNNDHRPMVEQQNLNVYVNKEANAKSEQVTKKENAEADNRQFNAKDKSDNEYYQNEYNNKGKKEEKDGKVVLKQQKINFDVKI